MTEQQLRTLYVNDAKSFAGAKQGDSKHKKIIDTYNQQRPLPSGYAVKYTDAWCATFVSAIALRCGLTAIIPPECSCGRQIALLQQIGAWQERVDYTPDAGDLIYYDWDDGTSYATTDNRGAPEHVGIVCAVKGKDITVIEGNKSKAVGYRSLKVNGRYIRGYGVPKYASIATTVPASADTAITKLHRLGIINSPDYWRNQITAGKIKRLDELFADAADKITVNGPRAASAAIGTAQLVTAGIINSPDYWLNQAAGTANLASLLCALGGAARATLNATQARAYTVVAGDTLSAIAKKFGTTVAALQEYNNIADANKINVGQIIRIPG